MKISVTGAGSVGGAPGTTWAGKRHAIVYGVRRPADDRVAGASAG